MLTTAQLLTAAKAAQGIPSNYRLARVLGVPDTTVQRWNTGRSRPDDLMAARLADLAGLDPGAVVAAINAERAEPGPLRDLWRGIEARLSSAATAAVCAIVALWIDGGPDGGASLVQALAAPLWITWVTIDTLCTVLALALCLSMTLVNGPARGLARGLRGAAHAVPTA